MTTLAPTPTTTSSPRVTPRPGIGGTGLAATVRQSFTMAYRGLVKIRRTPEQLFDVTLMPIVFTVMFTYIFGGAISGDVGSYLPVIIPGILVQTAITSSIVTGVQLREDMDKGVFDRFRSLPIARIAPLAGALLADTVRYAIATTITFVVGIVMGLRPPAASVRSCSRRCSSSWSPGRSAGSSPTSASSPAPPRASRASPTSCSSR